MPAPSPAISTNRKASFIMQTGDPQGEGVGGSYIYTETEEPEQSLSSASARACACTRASVWTLNHPPTPVGYDISIQDSWCDVSGNNLYTFANMQLSKQCLSKNNQKSHLLFPHENKNSSQWAEHGVCLVQFLCILNANAPRSRCIAQLTEVYCTEQLHLQSLSVSTMHANPEWNYVLLYLCISKHL